MLPVFDLAIVIGILALFCFLGFCFRLKKGSTSAKYFFAERQMGAVPAAISISVSFISSSSLTILIGEVYRYGCPFYVTAFVIFFAGPFVSIAILHRFYDSPFLSVFEFLEQRYSKSVRRTASVLFVFTGLMNLGVVGYTSAISAETLAGIPFWVSALATGLLSTAYSALGGIKAVIWTDVCQAVLMLLYMLLVFFKAIFSFDTLEEFWNVLYESKPLELHFQDGPTHRCSLQSYTSYSVLYILYVLCVSQPGVQRWKSVKSIKEARRTVYASLVAAGIYSFLTSACGVALYMFYARCTANEVKVSPDKLSLYFVSKELSLWPGIVGLCLSGILSGALSTISSFVNSMAAVTLEDMVKIKFQSLTTQQELNISKLLTAFYGVLSTGLIFVVSQTNVVPVIQVTSFSIVMGPSLAIFFLGMWTKKTDSFGVILGLIVSVALMFWISVGAFVNGHKHQPIPLDTRYCYNVTLNSANYSLDTVLAATEDITSDFLQNIYGISFYWYTLIGFASTAFFGYIFSLCSFHFCQSFPSFYARRKYNIETEISTEANDVAENLLQRHGRPVDGTRAARILAEQSFV